MPFFDLFLVEAEFVGVAFILDESRLAFLGQLYVNLLAFGSSWLGIVHLQSPSQKRTFVSHITVEKLNFLLNLEIKMYSYESSITSVETLFRKEVHRSRLQT